MPLFPSAPFGEVPMDENYTGPDPVDAGFAGNNPQLYHMMKRKAATAAVQNLNPSLSNDDTSGWMSDKLPDPTDAVKRDLAAKAAGQEVASIAKPNTVDLRQFNAKGQPLNFKINPSDAGALMEMPDEDRAKMLTGLTGIQDMLPHSKAGGSFGGGPYQEMLTTPRLPDGSLAAAVRGYTATSERGRQEAARQKAMEFIASLQDKRMSHETELARLPIDAETNRRIQQAQREDTLYNRNNPTEVVAAEIQGRIRKARGEEDPAEKRKGIRDMAGNLLASGNLKQRKAGMSLLAPTLDLDPAQAELLNKAVSPEYGEVIAPFANDIKDMVAAVQKHSYRYGPDQKYKVDALKQTILDRARASGNASEEDIARLKTDLDAAEKFAASKTGAYASTGDAAIATAGHILALPTLGASEILGQILAETN